MVNFKKQMSTHLSFIENSCKKYDQGFHEEALRIAVSLRVIFHDTPKSISILKHLGIKESISLLSTMGGNEEKIPEGHKLALSIPFMITMDGVIPPLNETSKKKIIPIKGWWNEIIFVQNGNFSRCDVVLSASNQDGGAHVDANPSRKTKELKQGIGSFTSTTSGEKNTAELIDYHYQLLRQIGFEVLNSQQLKDIIT